jgi:hypothetical protein
MLCYAMLCEDTHARMCEAHTFVRSLGDNKMPRLLIMPIYKPSGPCDENFGSVAAGVGRLVLCHARSRWRDL